MTPRQQELLDYIKSFRANNNTRMPTQREIAKHLGCTQQNVTSLLLRLERDGVIEKIHKWSGNIVIKEGS